MSKIVTFPFIPQSERMAPHAQSYLKRTAAAFLATLAAAALLELGGALGEGLLSIVGMTFLHITPPLLRFAGLDFARLTPPSPALLGIYSLFLTFYALALLALIPIIRLLQVRLAERSAEFGPPPARQQRRWLLTAGLCCLAALLLRELPVIPVENIYGQYMSIDLHLALFYGALAGGLATLPVLSTLQQLRKAPPGFVRPRATTGSISALHPRPEKPAKTASAFHIALAAELVQSIGQTSQPPEALVLMEKMTAWQRTAFLTGNAALAPADLAGHCHRTLELFRGGHLQALPDAAAARALYQQPVPGAISRLAEELQARLTLN